MRQNHELLDVIRLVRPLYKALEAAVETGLAETGLTLTQRAVLEEIFRQGPLTVPAIGRALIAPRQFIQTTVNALIQRGLVERRENAAHKRSVLIALTAAGQRQISEILGREADEIARVAALLDHDAIAATVQTMSTMIDEFQSTREGGER